jgi:hypothetical protein
MHSMSPITYNYINCLELEQGSGASDELSSIINDFILHTHIQE